LVKLPILWKIFGINLLNCSIILKLIKKYFSKI
jgi:hypothetical protein